MQCTKIHHDRDVKKLATQLTSHLGASALGCPNATGREEFARATAFLSIVSMASLPRARGAAAASTSSASSSGCPAKTEGRGEGVPDSPDRSAAARLSWAQLFARVFERDVTVCPACGGPTRVLAVITDTEVKRRILSHLGLPHEPPRPAPARAPPDPELAFDAEPELASDDPAGVA